jgi:hypothetical protein
MAGKSRPIADRSRGTPSARNGSRSSPSIPAQPSAFGEIWFAEADSPLGPWNSAVKVLSHDNYTFYNPRIQTDLTPEGASFILFEGTYTAEFANHARPTPRYNYNQILYRLDFADIGG